MEADQFDKTEMTVIVILVLTFVWTMLFSGPVGKVLRRFFGTLLGG